MLAISISQCTEDTLRIPFDSIFMGTPPSFAYQWHAEFSRFRIYAQAKAEKEKGKEDALTHNSK